MFICRFVGRSSVLLLFLLLFAIVLFFLLMDTQPDKRVVRSCTVLRTTCTTVALITLLMLCVFWHVTFFLRSGLLFGQWQAFLLPTIRRTRAYICCSYMFICINMKQSCYQRMVLQLYNYLKSFSSNLLLLLAYF